MNAKYQSKLHAHVIMPLPHKSEFTICTQFLPLNIACCRRLSAEQSQQSAKVLTQVQPDDAFVIEMLKHWWRPAAPTAEHAVAATAPGSSNNQMSQNADTAGQTPAQDHLACLTAGHPEAVAIDKITDQELQTNTAQGPGPQQDKGPTQNAVVSDSASRTEGRLQGSVETGTHASVLTSQNFQESKRDRPALHIHGPNHSEAEAAQAAAEVRTDDARLSGPQT